MVKGIVYTLSACLIWGFIYVVPLFLEGFTAIEVALGRYLCYGVISVILLLKCLYKNTCRYPLSIWLKAFFLALISSLGYYTWVVLSLRYADPAVSALILGVAPITIAFYGNWKEKTCSFKSLIAPSLFIFIGLVLINLPHLNDEGSSSHLFGLFCCFLALTTWTWYVIDNSKFLRKNPELKSSDWTTLNGVATLFWGAVLAITLALFFQDELHIDKYIAPSPELWQFIIGSIVLGFACSWLGAYLWNKACLHLPVSLAGQLTVFETIFGVLYIYAFYQTYPPPMEFLGMALFLIAIVYGVRAFSTKSEKELVKVKE